MLRSADVRARFLEFGIAVDEAVWAFAGLYPWGGGYRNDLLTRSRALVRVGDGIDVWARRRYGGRPTVRLAGRPLADFSIVRTGHTYDRVALGSQRFWVHRRHRSVIEGWARPR